MDGFKKFILRGNVIDLAIGIVIGAAFTAVVTAIVNGLITPIIGLFGSQNFDKLAICITGTCGQAPDGTPTGHVLLYGSVVTALIYFLIVAAVLYFGVVKPVNLLMERRKTEPEVAASTKACPDCLSNIPVAATRCAFCTIEQPALA